MKSAFRQEGRDEESSFRLRRVLGVAVPSRYRFGPDGAGLYGGDFRERKLFEPGYKGKPQTLQRNREVRFGQAAAQGYRRYRS